MEHTSITGLMKQDASWNLMSYERPIPGLQTLHEYELVVDELANSEFQKCPLPTLLHTIHLHSMEMDMKNSALPYKTEV